MSAQKSRRPIGQYLGRPIFEAIRRSEETLIFDRIAHAEDDGFPLDQLRRNEILLIPGLIYRRQ